MGEFPVDDPAGKAALLTVIAAGVWKLWLRLRHDSRNDKSEERDHAIGGDIADSYGSLVAQLREEVARLANSVKTISEALDAEREARYAAERLARELKDRVDILERRLRDLGHSP